MAMAQGVVGRMVDWMIRRSVRKGFRGVYWIPPDRPLPTPCVLVANHHGWHDGYAMYHAVTKLGIKVVIWIEEFEAFPLLASVGGMPFPQDDAVRRAATIRKTIRLLQKGEASLLLFGEGCFMSLRNCCRLGRVSI